MERTTLENGFQRRIARVPYWVALACAVSIASPAQQSAHAAGDFASARSYDNELAKFLYASYESKGFNNRKTVRYLVCNKHSAKDLLFAWGLAGFASGPNCPLRVNHCAVHERDVLATTRDVITTIEFIQDAQGHHKTAAVLPVSNDNGGQYDYGSGLLTTFFGYFGSPPQCPETTAKVELWVDFREETNQIVLDIFWNPPRVSIAFGIDRERYSDNQIESILSQLRKVDPEASLRAQSDVLDDNDMSWLGEEFKKGYYLQFRMGDDTDQRVRVSYNAKDVEIIEVPLIFLEKGKVQYALKASSLVPRKKQ